MKRPKRDLNTPASRSLVLLDRVVDARLVCSTVLTETGGLLHDDPCVQEMLDAEATLTAREHARGYGRGVTRTEVEQAGSSHGRNSRAVRRQP